LLNQIRKSLAPFIDRMGVIFAKTRVTPNGWSFIGLFFAVLSGLAFSSLIGNWTFAGILLLISGFFDVVDGAVARATGLISLRGNFIDSNFDRVSEIAVYAGIINGEIGEPILILGALSSSMLVSYIRAKAELFSIKLSGVGVGERAERLFLLAFLSILGYPLIGVIIVFIISLFTIIQRFLHVIKELE